MNRRNFIKTSGTAAALSPLMVGFPGLASFAASFPEKPNIIHIIGDDVGWDDIGAFGAKDIPTPHLDKLVQGGMKFTNFYAPHPTCSPTRASLLTGQYASRVSGGDTVLFPNSQTGLDPEKDICLPRILKKSGYNSACIGKWHCGHLPRFLPTKHGFDYYYGIPYPNDHAPERNGGTHNRGFPPIPLIVNDKVVKRLTNKDLANLPLEFIKEAKEFVSRQTHENKPFYLQLSNIETHTPWFVPQRFKGKSQAGAYGDAVVCLDYLVGQIMEHTKKIGIEKNTLIVYQADNGPLVWEYPELRNCYGSQSDVDQERGQNRYLRDGKYQAYYEGGPRVSAAAYMPGTIPAGKVSDEIFAGFDWFTTFIKLAGGAIPQDRPIDGKDITPILLNKTGAKSPHDHIFLFASYPGVSGVRKGRWKLTVKHKKEKEIIELYDLDKDPKEQEDVSGKNPAVQSQLYALYKQGRKELPGRNAPLETQRRNGMNVW